MGDYYKLSNKKYSKMIKIPIVDLLHHPNLSKKYIDSFFKIKRNYIKII